MSEKNIIADIKEKYGSMSNGEKAYANVIVPMWVSITVYMLIGVPILMP